LDGVRAEPRLCRGFEGEDEDEDEDAVLAPSKR